MRDRHDSALSEPYDRSATKKRLSVPTSTTCQATQELLLKKPGEERNEVNIRKLQPVLSDAGTVLPSNSPLARRRGSEILQREKTRALNRQLSLPEKTVIIEIDHCDEAGNEDQLGSDPEVVPFKNSLKVPAPFASLGTQLPRSPLLQQRSVALSPLDLQKSVSLPASPRFSRRRAATWNPEQSQERKDVFVRLGNAARKLRSMSVDGEEPREMPGEVSYIKYIYCVGGLFCETTLKLSNK